MPIRRFGGLTEWFGRTDSAEIGRSFGRSFGFGRTLDLLDLEHCTNYETPTLSDWLQSELHTCGIVAIVQYCVNVHAIVPSPILCNCSVCNNSVSDYATNFVKLTVNQAELSSQYIVYRNYTIFPQKIPWNQRFP